MEPSSMRRPTIVQMALTQRARDCKALRPAAPFCFSSFFFCFRLLWSATTTASSQRGLGRRIRLTTWLLRTGLPDRKWCKHKNDGEHRCKDDAKQHERSGTFWCYAGWVVGYQRNGCCPTWLTAQAGVTTLRSKVLGRNLSRQGLAPTCARDASSQAVEECSAVRDDGTWSM